MAIDHIAEGRFEPGFGAGSFEPEYHAHGYDFDDIGTRFDMLTEGLEIISSMLAGNGSTNFSGEHYRTVDLTCVPGPFDGPMPLWTVSAAPGPHAHPQNAARFCAGWNVPYVGPAEFRPMEPTGSTERV